MHNEPRFSRQEQALFFRRLALYARSGISLSRALGFIREAPGSKRRSAMVARLEQDVMNGKTLSSALAAFPKSFNRFSIGFVEAGEASGTLAETFERLSAAIERRNALQKKLAGACAYPSLVFALALCMGAFLTLFIFPKILPILTSFHTTLPLTTRVLIGITDFLERYWLACIIAFACLTAGFGMSLRIRAVRKFYEFALLRVPAARALYRSYLLANLFNTLSSLLRSGVRILPALALVRSMTGSVAYQDALAHIENRLSEGESFSTAFNGFPLLFPSAVSQLIAAGETTGTLRESLHTLAELHTDEFDNLTRMLTTLAEPVLMVGIGLVVGFVALAIITPIYQITGSLSTH